MHSLPKVKSKSLDKTLFVLNNNLSIMSELEANPNSSNLLLYKLYVLDFWLKLSGVNLPTRVGDSGSGGALLFGAFLMCELSC